MGAAEIVGLVTATVVLATGVVALIINVLKLRDENTKQHNVNTEIAKDTRDHIIALHGKVDRVAEDLHERMDRHEQVHHRNRRRW